MIMVATQKLHVGAGTDILAGWINHDLVPLPGVDVVHNLEVFPWPFENSSFNEIRMINVLEHLSNTINTLEELHRISAPQAQLTIRVPYWNSPDMATDPTHKAFFSEHTFDYFDPDERHCKERPYYSTARFKIVKKHYYIRARGYRKISAKWMQNILEGLAHHFCGIIWVIEFELAAIKA